MKKVTLFIIAILLMVFVNGQTYTTGQKDIFGNTTTVVKDEYGSKIGTTTTANLTSSETPKPLSKTSMVRRQGQ